MKLVFTSDWHADAMTGGFERFEDVEHAAERSVKYAVDNKADLYVMLGDLGDPDSPRIIRSISLAVGVAQDLAKNGINSIWIVGNHDVLEDGHGTTVLDPIEGVAMAQGCAVVVRKPGVWDGFLCLPYTAMTLNYDPIEQVQKLKTRPVGVLSHLMIQGISVGSETEDFARGRDVFLPVDEIQRKWPGLPIFNGHYHTRETYRGIEIPGSLCRLSRAEANNTPCLLSVEIP